MSELWSAEVVSKSGVHIVILLRAIHPDSGSFGKSKKFVFRLLYDLAFDYGPGLVLETRGPLGEVVALERLSDDDFLEENVDRYVSQVVIEDIRNAPFEVDELRSRIDRQLIASGLAPDDQTSWNAAWNARWQAFWEDHEGLPTATYKIDVTDPRWIAHLERGSRWESAAY